MNADRDLLEAIGDGTTLPALHAALAAWPAGRLARALRRLESGRRVVVLAAGPAQLVAPRRSRWVPRPRQVLDAIARASATQTLEAEGWTLAAREANRLILRDAAGHLALALVYAAAVRSRSVRQAIRRHASAGASPAREIVFVFTPHPGPLRRARWAGRNAPQVIVRDAAPAPTDCA